MAGIVNKVILLSICERFEPGSHFKSRLSLIIWVNVVLNRNVVVAVLLLYCQCWNA